MAGDDAPFHVIDGKLLDGWQDRLEPVEARDDDRQCGHESTTLLGHVMDEERLRFGSDLE